MEAVTCRRVVFAVMSHPLREQDPECCPQCNGLSFLSRAYDRHLSRFPANTRTGSCITESNFLFQGAKSERQGGTCSICRLTSGFADAGLEGQAFCRTQARSYRQRVFSFEVTHTNTDGKPLVVIHCRYVGYRRYGRNTPICCLFHVAQPAFHSGQTAVHIFYRRPVPFYAVPVSVEYVSGGTDVASFDSDRLFRIVAEYNRIS